MAQRPISRHTDFLDALHELYDLLVALAALPCGIQQPPHAIDLFDASAVRAAGYDEGVVCLLARMPYLDVDAHFSSLQLLPSTYPVTYVGEGLDEGYYASQRDMFDDDEQMMPATALRLTKGEGLEGTWLIYDMKTELMTAWQPGANPPDVEGFARIPGASPREVLGKIADDYRGLRYIGTPNGVYLDHEIFSQSDGQLPEGWPQDEWPRWRASYAVWKAVRGLKAIYLRFGWRTDAVEQTRFDRAAFLEKRAEYWQEIVVPLLELEEQAA